MDIEIFKFLFQICDQQPQKPPSNKIQAIILSRKMCDSKD